MAEEKDDKKDQCMLHNETLARVDENVQALHKWAFGNGQPGAAGRLIALETKVAEMRKPRQWPAIVASLCAVVAVVLNYIGTCQ